MRDGDLRSRFVGDAVAAAPQAVMVSNEQLSPDELGVSQLGRAITPG